MDDSSASPRYTLQQRVPPEVAIGRALITLIEPHRGHERAYNRWYEDDHFYGFTAKPWVFAGRRWVATRALQQLRYPASSRLAQPVTLGCYLSTYWITADRVAEFDSWRADTWGLLKERGRIFAQRDHVYTSFDEYRGAVYRDPSGPRDIHALDFPYQGLVFELVEAANPAARQALEERLKAEFIPQALERGAGAMCLVFRVADNLPRESRARTQDAAAIAQRIVLLWFLERDAAEVWADEYARHGALLERAQARLDFAAPFIPTRHGSDTYVDQLR